VVCHCCDDSFHASCHAPALLKRPTHKWLCYACTVKKALAVGQSMVTYGDKNSAQSLPIMHGKIFLFNKLQNCCDHIYIRHCKVIKKKVFKLLTLHSRNVQYNLKFWKMKKY
jgi:hypothetical protein